uniref:Poly [ADP-ribose] polymerase n=1 Tax=Leptobrachium leishanense TaxID=445787 RepID=A0A8C5R8V6_9ANUR
ADAKKNNVMRNGAGFETENTNPDPKSHINSKRSTDSDITLTLKQAQMTDVIVNSVGKDLILSSGGASKVLFEKAGKGLQVELDKLCLMNQVVDGSVFVTSGGQLSCTEVYHAVVPQWDGQMNTSEKILQEIVSVCLNTAAARRMNSIAFPAIGTGIMGFPKAKVAAIMFDEILSFSSRIKLQSLQEVHLVLHPSDAESIKVKHTANSQNKVTSSVGAVTSPAPGVHEMVIRSVICQVKVGDITKEDADIIVNSSNHTFNQRAGVGSALIFALSCCVFVESSLSAAQPNKRFILTQNGNLQCKRILHIYIKKTAADVKRAVCDVLQECEAQQFTSVAFPALGTGAARLPAAAVADAMLDALLEFATSSSVRHVQKVKVIVFQQTMVNDFSSSMTKKAASGQTKNTSFFSKITGTSKPLPINVSVCVCRSSHDSGSRVGSSTSGPAGPIERIQNSPLWLNYKIKKQSIDSRNGNANNEKQLFHGTDPNTILHVNHNGFNRSYAGKNAASYGNGTYFAVNAMYSAHDRYSRPDSNGYKYMYLTRVITGVYCVGTQGMVAPPAKNPSNTTDLYDSVTDNMAKPSMFVIFNDIQAYPEYLITFSK